MRRSIYFLFVVLLSCSGAGKESVAVADGVTISGKVGFPQQTGSIILERIDGPNTASVVDTLELQEDYTYQYQLESKAPGYFRLNFYNKQFVVFILDQDDVEINVDGNSRTGFFEIVGSRDHDMMNRIQNIQREMQSSEEFNDINTRFQQANRAGDREQMDEIRSEYVAYEARYNQLIVDQITEMPNSLASMDLLRRNILDKDKYFHVFEMVSNELSKSVEGNAMVDDFVTSVANMKKLAVGQIAPEIELPDPEGNMVKLSDLRGNYVLVDFWAKWCRPCRMENPNIVNMYKKYNDQGFEVFGVSLDRNRADWVQAIEEDGLHWTQVSDLKYWNSAAAKMYNVTAIPFGILLDPDGKIIAKNLRGAELQNKLAEIFD